MNPLTAKTLDLSTADQEQLERWVLDFDRSWYEGRLIARMREMPSDHPLCLAALAEMVKIELEKRWQRGQRLSLEDYLRQYPELGTPETVAASLIAADCQVRQQFGQADALEAAGRRFPAQADEVRKLLEELSQLPSFHTRMQSAAPSTSFATPPPGASTAMGGARPDPVNLPEWFGRYRVLRRLGKGGMGVVYQAHDTKLDRPVALKIPLFAAGDEQTLQRFHREARSAATLHHPHICPVFDVGEIDGIHYLSMAYVEGKTLAAELRERGPLPEAEAAQLVRTLALALAEAHQKGIVHRDLKPANVMLTPKGEPMVMDFGLARRTAPQEVGITNPGSILGTPAYMPPEQINGDVAAIGPGCDIYSLGVVLYELLTGRVPFRGTLTQVIHQIGFQEPERPSAARPGLSLQLEGIVMKTLAKCREDRYASMAEMAEALGAVKPPLRQPLNDSRPVPQAIPKRSVPRRTWRPLVAVLTCVAGMIVLGGIIVTIKDKDGKETKIEVPPGGTVTITSTSGPEPEPSPKPLDSKPNGVKEADIVQLLKLSIDEEAIIARIQKDGITFKPDPDVMERLKKAGSSQRLLRYVGGDRPIAAGKYDGDQALLEIVEIKRTKRDTMRVTVRIRNTSKKRYTAIGGSAGSWWSNAYYMDPMNKMKVRVAPDDDKKLLAGAVPRIDLDPQELSVELWAEFPIPTPGVKKLNFYFMFTNPIDEVPIPEPEREKK